MPTLCAADVHEAIDGQAGKRQQGQRHDPLLPAKHLQSLGKIVKHAARMTSSMIPAETASPVR
jgi:hypothetical protein